MKHTDILFKTIETLEKSINKLSKMPETLNTSKSISFLVEQRKTMMLFTSSVIQKKSTILIGDIE